MNFLLMQKKKKIDALGQKKGNNNQHIYSHLGFFLMSSNWPTTWDTFVLTILNAISSSPMISNLPSRGAATISNASATVKEVNLKEESSLVLVLVFEGFVDAFSHGFAMEDEALRDRRLHTKEH